LSDYDPISVVGILIKNHASLDLVEDGEGGRTPLMYACQKGWLESGKMLVEHGADVNQ